MYFIIVALLENKCEVLNKIKLHNYLILIICEIYRLCHCIP